MRTLKNELRTLVLAGTVLTAPFAMAQQDGRDARKAPGEQTEARVQHMTAELGLSAEQAAKITAIHESHGAKHKQAMEDARREKHEAIKAVLTEEQYARMLELRKERKGKVGHRKQHGKKQDGTPGDALPVK